MKRTPMGLVIAGAAALAAAAVAAVVWASSSSSSSSGAFVMEGKARFWRKELAPELAAALAKLRATPHSQVERVWVLGPTGPESALDRVRAIQAKGDVATSTPNLLDPSSTAGKGLGELTAAEFLNYADPTAAVLPVL